VDLNKLSEREVTWFEGSWFGGKTMHGNGGDVHRKTDRRHDNLSEELKTDSWSDLWETMTMALLLRFG
jgi:hypothetical protein